MAKEIAFDDFFSGSASDNKPASSGEKSFDEFFGGGAPASSEQSFEGFFGPPSPFSPRDSRGDLAREQAAVREQAAEADAMADMPLPPSGNRLLNNVAEVVPGMGRGLFKGGWALEDAGVQGFEDLLNLPARAINSVAGRQVTSLAQAAPRPSAETREAALDNFGLSAPATMTGQLAEGFTQHATQAAPVLAATGGLGIPVKAAGVTTGLLTRAGASPLISNLGGITAAAMTGDAMFDASAAVPQAILDNDPMHLPREFMRASTNTASAIKKTATGRPGDISLEEGIDTASTFLPAVWGARQAIPAFKSNMANARALDAQLASESAARQAAERAAAEQAAIQQAESAQMGATYQQVGSETGRKMRPPVPKSPQPVDLLAAQSAPTTNQRLTQNPYDVIEVDRGGGVPKPEAAMPLPPSAAAMPDVTQRMQANPYDLPSTPRADDVPMPVQRVDTPPQPVPPARVASPVVRPTPETTPNTSRTPEAAVEAATRPAAPVEPRTPEAPATTPQPPVPQRTAQAAPQAVEPQAASGRGGEAIATPPRESPAQAKTRLRAEAKALGVDTGNKTLSQIEEAVANAKAAPQTTAGVPEAATQTPKPKVGSREGGFVDVSILADTVNTAVKTGKWTADTTVSAARWLASSGVDAYRTVADAVKRLVQQFGEAIRPYANDIWLKAKRLAVEETGSLDPARLGTGKAAREQNVTKREGGFVAVPEGVAKRLESLGEDVRESGGDALQGSKFAVQRASKVIRDLGETGQALARDMDEVEIKAAPMRGRDLTDTAQALKGYSPQEIERAAKYVNGRLTDPTPAEKQLGDTIRGILDRGMNAARETGQTRLLNSGKRVEIGGSGKAIPQVLNDEGRRVMDRVANNPQGPEALRLYDDMVREGKAKDTTEAALKMRQWQEQQQRGTSGYFERQRVELPDNLIEWDMRKTLPSLIEKNASFVAMLQQWGADVDVNGRITQLPGLKAQLQAIRDTHGPRIADRVDEFFKFETGLRNESSVLGSKALQTLSNFQTASKLSSPISALRNSLQPILNPRVSTVDKVRAFANLPPVASRWMKNAKALKETIDRSGAVRSHTVLSDVEPASGSLTNKALTAGGFSAAESGNQYRTALMARYQIERDLGDLMELKNAGPAERIRKAITSLGENTEGAKTRNLEKSGVTPERLADLIASGKPLTESDFQRAMYYMVRDTQFTMDMTTRRMWWTQRPAFRALAKFKTFSLEQTGLIYRDVIKEAMKGNFAPSARFAAGTMLAGEIYNVARDMVTGNQESVTVSTLTDENARNPGEIGKRMLSNIVDGGGVGIIADMVYGVGDSVLGPTASTIANVGKAAVHTLQRPSAGQAWDAAVNLAQREIPVTRQARNAYRRIESMFDDDAKMWFDYHEVRRKARDFDADRKAPTTGEKIKQGAITAIAGREDFIPGRNTLTYQQAVNSLAGNQIDSASDYIAVAIADANTVEEVKQKLGDVKRRLGEGGPLGPIRQKDYADFLRTLTPEQRENTIKLHGDWNRRVKTATEKALTKAIKQILERNSKE